MYFETGFARIPHLQYDFQTCIEIESVSRSNLELRNYRPGLDWDRLKVIMCSLYVRNYVYIRIEFLNWTAYDFDLIVYKILNVPSEQKG